VQQSAALLSSFTVARHTFLVRQRAHAPLEGPLWVGLTRAKNAKAGDVYTRARGLTGKVAGGLTRLALLAVKSTNAIGPGALAGA
jgi:hypothetical protein